MLIKDTQYTDYGLDSITTKIILDLERKSLSDGNKIICSLIFEGITDQGDGYHEGLTIDFYKVISKESLHNIGYLSLGKFAPTREDLRFDCFQAKKEVDDGDPMWSQIWNTWWNEQFSKNLMKEMEGEND
ncbi:MAG TPA: hypothetical protein DF712_06605 [Balneola sp.]|nr:hypothetical protein [Balneola sp.]|tara:strand:- start:272 stop:661 length:390 start_codon:yes stop_codon:yes gene_type:complete